MITELASQEKVVGVKQSRKAIREGRARRVYLACDADPAITDPIAASCAQAGTILRNLFENMDKMLALPQTQPLTMPSATDFDEEDLADLDRTLVRAAVFPSA